MKARAYASREEREVRAQEEKEGGGERRDKWSVGRMSEAQKGCYKKNLNLNLQKTVAGLLDWQSLQFAD